MGRDKHENEHLIAYGWPEDLWFHVHNHSSAHVYLRLPKGETIEDVPEDVVTECCQLTKANSIEGCKLSHVPIVYTPWSNLAKRAGMADGQVGFHDRHLVKQTVVEHRVNAIVNRLTKTKVEKHNNPRELEELRRERDAEDEAEHKSAAVQARKEAALAAEVRRMQRHAEALSRDFGEVAVDGVARAERLTALEAQLEAELAAKERARAPGSTRAVAADSSAPSPAPSSAGGSKGGKKGKVTDKRGASVSDAMLMADLFAPAIIAAGAGDVLHDEMLWGGSDDEEDWLVDLGADDGAAAGVDISDGGFGAGGASKRRDGGGLGALGQEAAAVQAARKTDYEMEALTKAAHERRAEAQRKADERERAKAAKEEAATAALEAKRQQLHGQRAEVAGAVAAHTAAALAALAGVESLEAVHEANRGAQEEECMVLEAIFGDEAMVREEPPADADAADAGGGAGAEQAAFTLQVEGETADGGSATITLRVGLPPAYPSHLPPSVAVVDGVPSDDAAFVADALRRRYFEQREAAGADAEPSECVVLHQWTEWLREEWMANQ